LPGKITYALVYLFDYKSLCLQDLGCMFIENGSSSAKKLLRIIVKLTVAFPSHDSEESEWHEDRGSEQAPQQAHQFEFRHWLQLTPLALSGCSL
jgi:hypothetical protein